jgi:glycosyltransferase involved in cell wall biosynthesis
MGLTYYTPHVSGLTITVKRLAEGLVRQGHEVCILASAHDSDLPAEETIAGVRILRLPAMFRISKGVIMPSYALFLARLVKKFDAGILNLPCTPVESFFFPVIFALAGRPAVSIIHCDLQLPSGLINRLIDAAVFASGLFAGFWSKAMVTYTSDYAQHAPLMRCFAGRSRAIAPPVEVAPLDRQALELFRKKHAADGQVLVGFPCRFAAEKGVEILLAALPRIWAEIENVKVVFAGEYRDVIGEEEYVNRLMPFIEELGTLRWEFLGVLSPAEMSVFFSACSVCVLPSLNRTESFGLVQVESMLCGTPVVASDLPGVRVPVKTTGMGIVIPPGDAEALAEAVVEIIKNISRYKKPVEFISGLFSPEKAINEYENLLQSFMPAKKP